MILTALHQYYYRLASNPDRATGMAKVPPYGFSEEKIGYVLILSKEGQLIDAVPNYTDDKKPQPKLLRVPQPSKKSVNISPNFLWGNTQYVLSITNKEIKPPRTVHDYFEAFRTLHLEQLKDVNDAGLMALVIFLRNWQPEQFDQSPCKPEMVDTNLVFKLDGEKSYLHESVAAQKIWTSIIEPEDAAQLSQCLITGERAPIARLHAPIKGGYLSNYGGKTGGCSIVSFNKKSFESYKKTQGENAPVSESAAFAYTTALNYLLRRENGKCVSIGDTSTVFWAVAEDEKTAHEAESLFNYMLNMPTDDGKETVQIKPLLEKIAQGRPLNEFAPNIALSTRFFVLGLAPNASRLSIRYWLDTNFGDLAQHVTEHFQDLSLMPQPWRDPPSIWRLLIQTAAQGKSENIPPQLAGEWMRAIITGQRYPRMVLTQITQRIRSDGDINGIRVAVIKAIIQRDFRKGLIQEEVPMSLDLNSSNIAYRLGRLFAAIERIQEAALGREVNSTVADKYYGAASAIPFSVFPRLLSGSQNHLTKVRKDKPGYAVMLKKDLGEIIGGLDNSFPRHLSIEGQGRFAIGYYHQKQSYFETKSKSDDVNDVTANIDNDQD